MSDPALSFVIPLYNAAETIAPLVREIEALDVPGGQEIVLVDDGSRDGTAAVVRRLIAEARVPVVLIRHSRNYGEHNAILTGWRHALGTHLVNLDDDGQNPPGEALRLWRHAVETGCDAVYGHYLEKRHSAWRNFGSWFTNRMTEWALEKPSGFYLSSFRCVTALVAREAAQHSGPFPYVDGLVLQVTQNLGSLEVRHDPRRAGASGYTFRRLVRLWLSAWINFSVLPLRLATLGGLGLAVLGIAAFVVVIYLHVTNRGPAFGWGSLMAVLLLSSGMQLVMLGLIGEYIGRMFLAVNRRPQSVVREIVRK